MTTRHLHQRRAVVAALLAALIAPAACTRSGSDEAAPRLVVLYATCTVNCQYLSPYNPGVSYTPHLDVFTEHATVFAKHQTEAGASGVAYASIFSGTDTLEHGVYAHPKRLPETVQLVTEVFADAGFEVFTWLNHPMANAALNYAQGVDAEHTSEQMLEARDPGFQEILDRLQSDPTYRALIVTNFTVTHRPYPAKRLDDFCREYPDECLPRQDAAAFDHYRDLFRSDHIPFAYDFERAVERHGLTEADVQKLTDVVEVLYKACVYRLDRSFGRIVAEIDRRHLLPESVIVFTADHGEVLHRDNLDFKWCHAFQLAPEVLSVPLIIHAPAAGISRGVYDGVTRSIDVLPTLAGLANVSMPDYAGPGVDLSAAMSAEKPPPPLLAFSHSSLLPHSMAERLDELGHLRALFPQRDPDLMWVAVRSEDSSYKLRRRDGRIVASVYDLAADPTEAKDLYDPAADQQQAVLEQLRAYRVSLIEAYDVWEGRPGELDEDERIRILRSLGYVR